jgi:hypothetical protein
MGKEIYTVMSRSRALRRGEPRLRPSRCHVYGAPFRLTQGCLAPPRSDASRGGGVPFRTRISTGTAGTAPLGRAPFFVSAGRNYRVVVANSSRCRTLPLSKRHPRAELRNQLGPKPRSPLLLLWPTNLATYSNSKSAQTMLGKWSLMQTSWRAGRSRNTTS